MLVNIKRFFESNFAPGSSNIDDDPGHAVQLAMAALMIEVAESDYKDAPEEQETLFKIIKSSVNIDEKEANELIKLAKAEHHESTDYFQFTRLINNSYSAEEKIRLIENLWQIAFADSILDKYEEHVIRRISDLIYVSHSDFMATKLRVMEAQG